MDSSGDDDEGEEWRGDWSSAVSSPFTASRAVTQRSTAGSLHRSTSEHTHTSVWTGHTHTQRSKIQVVPLKTRRGQTECRLTQSRVRVRLINGPDI